MSTVKTLRNDASVEAFIASVPDEQKRADSHELLKLFTRATGERATMWGTSIIGFGQYHYKSERSRQEADWMLTGFSPRKQNLTLYLMSGFDAVSHELALLGKHKLGKGCLYINKLSDVDMDVLESIVKKVFESSKKAFI